MGMVKTPGKGKIGSRRRAHLTTEFCRFPIRREVQAATRMLQCLSRSRFRRLKCSPEIPEQFGSFMDGMPFCQMFLYWDYIEQCHTGIVLMTPEQQPAIHILKCSYSP